MRSEHNGGRGDRSRLGYGTPWDGSVGGIFGRKILTGDKGYACEECSERFPVLGGCIKWNIHMLEVIALYEGIDSPIWRLDRIRSRFPRIGWPATARRNRSGERGDLRRDGA